jgi:hypothetical protein
MGPFSNTTRIADRWSVVHSIVLYLKELKPNICSKYRGMLTDGIVLQYDNARPHIALATVTTETIWKLKFELVPHPSYFQIMSHLITIFLDCSQMCYVDADLLMIKRSRTWCIHVFALYQKHSLQKQSESSWTKETNMWRRKRIT